VRTSLPPAFDQNGFDLNEHPHRRNSSRDIYSFYFLVKKIAAHMLDGNSATPGTSWGALPSEEGTP